TGPAPDTGVAVGRHPAAVERTGTGLDFLAVSRGAGVLADGPLRRLRSLRAVQSNHCRRPSRRRCFGRRRDLPHPGIESAGYPRDADLHSAHSQCVDADGPIASRNTTGPAARTQIYSTIRLTI